MRRKLHSTYFLHGLSKEMSPLCKQHRDNQNLQNFELMVVVKLPMPTLELMIHWSKETFEDQIRLAQKGDDERTVLLMKISWEHWNMVCHLRLIRNWNGSFDDVLTNNSSIQEVLLFPQMRPEKTSKRAWRRRKLIVTLYK
jgi:lysyl-tRNA synthetase class 2